MSRVFTMPVASVYPHYVNKVEKKGRTQAELDEVIEWLTGYDDAQLQARLADGTTLVLTTPVVYHDPAAEVMVLVLDESDRP